MPGTLCTLSQNQNHGGYNMHKNILLVFRAINHRTLKAREYDNNTEREAREKYRSMNVSALQTLFALDIIDQSQYDDLYIKVWRFKTININDINNLL